MKNLETVLTTEEQNYLSVLEDTVTRHESFMNSLDDKDSDMIISILTKLPNAYKQLQHHHDTTVGLYATDKPELVIDDKNVLFRIESSL